MAAASAESKSKVVIVGGGVMGLCTAYYLCKQGIPVTLLEMGDVGNGASLGNAGYVSPSHFVPLAAPGVFAQGLKWMFNPTSPLYIKPRLDWGFLVWTAHFARACDARHVERAVPVLRDLLVEAQGLYEEMFAAGHGRCDYTKHGLTLLFKTDKARARAEHEVEWAGKIGMTARMVDAAGLAAMDPGVEFEAHGGAHFPHDAHMVPAELVASLAVDVTRMGAQIERNCRLERWERSGNRIVRIVTNRGTFAADEFVLATGAWSPQLLRDTGIRMLLQAGKGYSITYANPPRKPLLPYLLMESRVAVTPFPHGLRFAGTMEIAGVSTTINRPRVEAILNAIPRYFRNLPRPDSTQGEIWGGMRPVTPDGMPYIGRFRKAPNLIAATGHAMVGLSLAPVTGKIVAELIAGGPQRDLRLLSPDRF